MRHKYISLSGCHMGQERAPTSRRYAETACPTDQCENSSMMQQTANGPLLYNQQYLQNYANHASEGIMHAK